MHIDNSFTCIDWNRTINQKTKYYFIYIFFLFLSFNGLFFVEFNQARIPVASMSESPSIANSQSKQSREQQCLAVRAQNNSRNSNSLDSASFKANSNGKVAKVSYVPFRY